MQKHKTLPDPYPTRNLNGAQVFTTDQGVQYAMGFRNVSHHLSPVLGIYDIRVYTFDFFSSHHGLKDERVQPTITAAISEFLEEQNRVVGYVCDMGDGRQRARQKLFTKWTENTDIHHIKLDADPMYGGVLTRKDFQHRDVLLNELLDPSRGIMKDKPG